MMSIFVIVPLTVCIYEILSLILPLKISLSSKIVCAVMLLAGLGKIFLYRRTSAGFDLYELPYALNLIISLIFNFIVIALFLALVKDIIFIVCRFIIRCNFPAHHISLFVLSIGICATLFGTYEGLRVPDVNIHEVKIKNLGKDLDGLKIAMLVDIHADQLSNKNFVSAVVSKTNALNPDLILIPGDFVDGQVESRSADVAPLKNLRAKFGVYATTGNHEYYFNLSGWLEELKSLGIKFLENQHIIITSGDSKLILAGVPDQTSGNHNVSQALQNIPENSPIILMDHRPSEARENAKFNIDLQLSGHTHGGQMPGLKYLVARANKGFARGWYKVENMSLYVSPGTSQWNGFSVRLLDPSEITLFILRSDL
ncbi:MAG: metallophosphoesterase [Synergistaceae bacterium]|nr:metallophosphoesterase [Synergistaceae bacterium]